MAAIEQRRRCFAVPRRNASRRFVSCTRDALGRLATQTETVGAATTEKAYAYDLRGRLVSVTTGGVVTEWYAYDLNGIRRNSPRLISEAHWTKRALNQRIVSLDQ